MTKLPLQESPAAIAMSVAVHVSPPKQIALCGNSKPTLSGPIKTSSYEKSMTVSQKILTVSILTIEPPPRPILITFGILKLVRTPPT